jgi:L-amino acid N-acyltransferase YncA
MNITIRNAVNDDLPDIVEILNQAIKTHNVVGFTNIFKVNDRKEWFIEHTHRNYPVLVAEYDNKILGWISVSPYRKGRKALDRTAEVSCFIHEDYQRKGIGSSLLSEVLKISENLAKSILIAIIFNTNTGSRRLLEKNNFEIWGILPEVAEIDGKKLDHIYYGKKL